MTHCDQHHSVREYLTVVLLPQNIFVSHAWKNSFTELMSALLQEAPESKVSKLSKKPDVVYWVRLLSCHCEAHTRNLVLWSCTV